MVDGASGSGKFAKRATAPLSSTCLDGVTEQGPSLYGAETGQLWRKTRPGSGALRQYWFSKRGLGDQFWLPRTEHMTYQLMDPNPNWAPSRISAHGLAEEENRAANKTAEFAH
jgi:hypothetical protein